MADNFRARINSRGTYLYKNARIGEDLSSERSNAIITQTVYIPNISNIDLNQFKAAYAYNDKEKTRPYYVRIFKSEGFSKPIPSSSIATSEKLDLGNNKITFFSLDNSENLVGVRDTFTDPTIEYENCPFDPNKYSLAAPFSVGGNFGGEAYRFAYEPDLQASNDFFKGGLDALREIVKGDGIEGLQPYKNDDIDAVLVPYDIGIGQNFNNANMFKQDGDIEYSMGYAGYVSTTPSTFYTQTITNNNVPYRVVCYRNRDLFNIKGKSISTGDESTVSLYNMCTYPDSISSDDTWKYYTLGNTTRGSIISFAFLADDNGDIWILTISQALWQKGDSSVYPGKFVSFACLTKVENLPTNRVVSNTKNEYGYPSLTMTSSIDVQETFKKMLKLESYSYDDGGPDIEGPGDPYGDIDNVDQIVGGQDVNTDKEIDNVDSSPNTDYDRFALATGFFGSYVLEKEDLERYTKTLSELYSHSNDLFAGEACQAQANRLESNVTGLIMLPFDIPQTDYQNTVFALGNVGIMGDGSWGDYVLGKNYANANYLTKFTKTYNLSLGTINHNYDNFLDFAPYSTASLFIPYIGKVELPINLIQSTETDQRPLTLQFRINYTSGDFVAILICNIKGNDIPLCNWNGNCARPIKVAVNDDSEAIRSGTNRIVSMFTASMNLGSSKYQIGNSGSTGYESAKPYATRNLSVRSPSIPSSVTTSQHLIGNGSVAGELGFLGPQKVILKVERPIWWRPYDYGDLIGYPTKKIAKLSSVSGFARVTDVHVRCSATSDEKDEIASILSQGVIF